MGERGEEMRGHELESLNVYEQAVKQDQCRKEKLSALLLILDYIYYIQDVMQAAH